MLQIESLRSAYPPSQTALESLDGRLNEVRRLVPLAAHHADEDAEYVHQLRVATREALAAIDAYATLLPAEESESLSKCLRRIRSAAGKARDLDVMLTSQRNSNRTGRRSIAKLLREKRKRAQRPLVKIVRRFNRRQRFDVWIKACLNAIRDVPPDYITAIVRDRVHVAAEALVRGSPGADAGARRLHRFRIKAKHLRYTIELGGLTRSGTPLHHLYSTACEIQKMLGVMNDHQVASKRYRQIGKKAKSKRSSRRMEELAKGERANARKSRANFHNWWRSGQRKRVETLNAICFESSGST